MIAQSGQSRVATTDDASHDSTITDKPLNDTHIHAQAVKLFDGDVSPAPEERRFMIVLESLKHDERTAFVLFELEGMACERIAELVRAPIGTIYSRLHSARRQIQLTLARLEAEERHGMRVRGWG